MNYTLSDLTALWPVLIIFSLLIPMRAVITTVHEAGHAIAIVLLTKKRVSVYLGSYGDKEGAFGFSLGSFDIWIKLNLLRWKGGLCIPAATAVDPGKRFLYVLAGPVASLLLAVAFLLVFLLVRPQGMVAPFLILFCIFSTMSFLYNIVPAYAAIITGKGNLTYNDGAQLKKLLDVKKLPPEYEEAVVYLREGQYVDAARILEQIIKSGTRNADIYRMAITGHMALKNYSAADRLQRQQIEKIGNINTSDRINLALLKTHLGKYEEAIGYYKHLLQSGGNNKFNLNNLGYTLTLMGRYEEAIPYLDKAILIDADFAAPYCNRGYARHNIGLLEDGKKDNEHSIQLDSDNSYAYRNLGIYFYDRGMYNDALKQFEKAKEIDPHIALLDRYILDVATKMAGDS